MPETRLERIVFVIGLIAAVVVAGSIFLSLKHGPARRGAGEAAPTTATTAARVTRTPAPAAAPATTAVRTRPHQAAAISLWLTASRGSSWLEVRSGSARGRVLYAETLSAGRSAAFRGRRLWLRLGAASNLDASLGGRPLRLPGGTYSTLVTAKGLGPLGP